MSLSLDHDFDRRRFVTMAAALLAPGASAPALAAPGVVHTPWSDEEIFDAYVRMRGSHAEHAVYERTVGLTYSIADDRPARLLWAVDGITVSWFRRAGAERVAGRNRYLGVMRDPYTGDRLRRLEDTESGVSVDVPLSHHPTAEFALTPGGVNFGAAGDGRQRLQPTVLGSTVSFTDQMFAPPTRISQPKLDVVTLTADRVRAFDAGLPSVDAVVSFTGIERWRPWMRQGERPGGLFWHVTGRKVERSEVPAEFFDLALEVWNAPLDAA